MALPSRVPAPVTSAVRGMRVASKADKVGVGAVAVMGARISDNGRYAPQPLLHFIYATPKCTDSAPVAGNPTRNAGAFGRLFRASRGLVVV